MGILNSLGFSAPNLEIKAGVPGPADDSYYQPVGVPSLTGIRVDEITALRASAVLACVRRISDSFASMPLFIFQNGFRKADGTSDPTRGKTRVANHPLSDVLHHQPNPWMTAYEFWQLNMVFALLWGDAYNKIVSGPRGFTDTLIPLHPGRVKTEQLPNGRIVYTHTGKTGQAETIPQERMFHIQGMSLDGVVGLDTITMAREAIALALASEAYAARLFANDASGRVIISHPQKLEEGVGERIAASWRSAYAGFLNAGKVAVMEEGMTATVLSQTGKEAEQIATREFQAIEIARIFGVPQHKIGILKNATFSNIVEQNIEYVQDTLTPWAVRIEQAIRRDLIVAKNTFYAKFILEGLLRGDPKTRAAFYNTMIPLGVLTRNEVRELEDRNPLDGLDEPLTPLNMGGGGAANMPADGVSAEHERMQSIVQDVGAKIIWKEVETVRKLAERHASDAGAFSTAVAKFYNTHAAYIAENLHVPAETTVRYVMARKADLADNGVAVLELWRAEGAARLETLSRATP